MKKFELTTYSDFNTELLNRILSKKYSISSLSYDYVPNIIRPVCKEFVHSESVLFWHSLESFKKTYGLFFLDTDSSIVIKKIDDAVNSYLQQISFASNIFKHILVCSINKTREGRGQLARNYTLSGDSFISAKINLALTQLSQEVLKLAGFCQFLVNQCKFVLLLRTYFFFEDQPLLKLVYYNRPF